MRETFLKRMLILYHIVIHQSKGEIKQKYAIMFPQKENLKSKHLESQLQTQIYRKDAVQDKKGKFQFPSISQLFCLFLPPCVSAIT